MSVVPLYRLDSRHPQAQVCLACEVRRSALFGALDEEGLDRIHAHIASLELPADARLHALGERGDAVYTVRSGVLRFERVTAHGERRIVRLAGRGDLVGQEALLHRAYADDAVACTPLQVCRIPRSLVEHLGGQRAELMRELMARWQRALDEAEAWVAELASGPARRRLLALLARLSAYGEDGLIWMPRREEIGAMLDLTLETASRQVSALRRDGLLELLPGRAARVDAAALRIALSR